MTEFSLAILSPDREWFSGAAESVTAPGIAGEFGLLARHEFMVAGLKAGVVTVRMAGGDCRYFTVDGGVLGVEREGVRILTGQVAVFNTLEEALKSRAEAAPSKK